MNTITIVSNLINEAVMRFGAIDAIEVPEPLWERAMDEVADAGGEVAIDYCVVDGVAVRLSGDADDTVAFAHVPGSGERHPVSIADEGPDAATTTGE